MSVSQASLAGNISFPKITGTPSVTGTVSAGNTLTANPGTWYGTQPINYSYQWQQNGSPIPGATNSTYLLDRTYLGITISFVVSVSNPVGSNVSEQSAGIVSGSPINSVLPTISGTAISGNSLSVNTGTWTGYPTSYTYTYQWYNSSVGSINNATASTYTLAVSDQGFTVYCIVTASNGVTPNGTAQTASTTTVAAPTPTYAFGSIPASIDEGSSGTFNVNTTNVPDGTTLYWTLSNTTTSDADFSATSGSFTITSNTGSFTMSPVADTTTEGAETFQICIRTGSVIGSIVATSASVTVNDTSLTPTPTYAFGSIPASIDEGSSGTFNVNTTNVPDGTTLYWTLSNTTTVDADFSATSGSFTITSNTGSFTMSPVADTTTEGAETFQICIRTGSVIGSIVATSASVTVNDTSLTPTSTGQAMFAFSGGGAGIGQSNKTNLISSGGVIAGDVVYSGTSSRGYAAGTRYGIDKAIFGFGTSGGTSLSTLNLVSNKGVMVADSSSINNPTASSGKAGTYYDTNKGMFGFGLTSGSRLSTLNLVSNTGVVAGDIGTSGTARYNLAAASYGTDQAIFGFGVSASSYCATITLFSNTAVMTSDTSSSGYARDELAACSYGGDKAIFGFGFRNLSPYNQNIVTRFSSTGAYVSQTAVTGTYRGGCNGADYGGNKGIFGYGGSGSGTVVAITTVNKVDNLGNVAAAVAGAGSGRQYGASASF